MGHAVYFLDPGEAARMRLDLADFDKDQDQMARSSQSRSMSLVETVASTGIGLFINTVANFTLLPLWGLHPSVSDSVALAVMFTGLSVCRGFVLRRLFEWVRVRWGNLL
jgi:hypothetical protein